MKYSFRIQRKRLRLFRHARIRTIKRTSKKPFVFIPAVTIAGLSVVTLSVFGLLHLMGGKSALEPTNTRIVIVSYDKQQRVVPTTAKTVGELLRKMDIQMASSDVVEPSKDTEILEDNFHVNVYRALPVLIIDGSKRTSAVSAATTPRSIAKQAGVVTYPEDKLQTLPTENFLTEGGITQKVVIDRATPVHVNLYGTTVTLRTHAKTVKDLLKERNINLGKDDAVQPIANTPLTEQSQVFVTRKGVQIATVEESIPMPAEIVEDTSLSFGTTALRQQGSPGKKLVTYQIELRNGIEVSRKPIQEVIAQEPVKQITARGKAVQIPSDKEALLAAAGIAKSDFGYVNYIISRENALWCPTRWQGQRHCPAYYEEKYPGAESDTSLGYGMCQSTPANKMAANGPDWRTNPVTQLKWCSDYATRRYGSWAGAYAVWQSKGWW